tara:strand:+ start:4092 stop:4229 length:138 start_codon:yes stop_codon:yes gene_type:complete
MKTKSQKKRTSIDEFSKNEIKYAQTIVGGKKGPIEKDKIKRPSRR